MKKKLISILTILLFLGLFSLFINYNKKGKIEDNIFKNEIRKIDVMVLENYNSNLYVGTTKGLFILKEKENNFILEEVKLKIKLTFIRSVFKDSNDNLWVGGNEGLICILKDGREILYDKESGDLPDNRINSIMESSQGNIWIGTWGGAAEINKNGSINIFKKEEGLLVDMVNQIIEDDTKGILFASYNVRSGGISYLKNNKFSYYTDKNGLVNINTTAIIKLEDGSLYVGSGMFDSGGITVLKPQGDNLSVVKIYKIEDGLAGDKVRSIKKIGDTLLIGSEYDGFALWKDDGSKKIYTVDDGLPNNEVKCFSLYMDTLFVGTKEGLGKSRGTVLIYN